MEQRSGDKSTDSDFVFDPTNKVVGIIDAADDVKAALRDLTAAGFTADEVEVLAGEEAARQINVPGGGHQALVYAVRPAQKPVGHYDAPGLIRQVEQHLQAGHFSIGVAAPRTEAREQAHKILKSHRGHFINFCGTWAVEALEP